MRVASLFTMNSQNSVESYSPAQQELLGTSSIWFVVVGAAGLAHPHPYLRFCGAFIIVCGLLSMLFWWKPEQGGLRHLLDKYAATLYFVQFFVVNLISWFRFLSLLKMALYLSIIIAFFLASDLLLTRGDFDVACWAHLLYRYFCYVGLGATFVPGLRLEVVAACSCVYFLHCLSSLHRPAPVDPGAAL